ncbi:bacterio-opsin activator domain-containing protein [Halomarina salina]|uniref:Bacterio-opsin activator domain-containing protein n=1 Tax=Halomarina salina TaxID=1872699 RepID=A0ABD5RJR8_9EURY|nr:bacterio-opsin activator domain-containing protein [Halomarina salina]
MIVKFVFQQPTLLDALRQMPSTRVRWEESHTTPNGEMLMLFWAESDDFEAFEAAMHDDPTVTAPRLLTEFTDRRLYQVEQIGEGRAQSVYDSLTTAGGIIEECIGTHDGWTVEIEFPDNDTLQHFHSVCEDHGLEFDLLQKYEASENTEQSNHYGLSKKQRETLIRAAEKGYFHVPRGTDLDTIAAELDISHQAASERVRRAMDILIDHTLAPAREDPPTERH